LTIKNKTSFFIETTITIVGGWKYRAKEKEEVARYKPEPAKINLGEILQAELQRIEELKEEEKNQEEQQES